MGDPPPHIARYLSREAALRDAAAASASAARASAIAPFYIEGGGASNSGGVAQEARERLAELTSTAAQLVAVRRARLRAQRDEEMRAYAAELAAMGLAMQSDA